MESDIIRTLDHCQRILERVLLDYSLNKQEHLLSNCLIVVNCLNPILGSTTVDHEVLQFAEYTLKLYERLKNKEPNILSIEEKLLWISSKVNGLVIPPCFMDKTFIDYNSPFSETLLPVPCTLDDVEFEKISQLGEIDWSEEGIQDIYQDKSPDCSFVAALLSVTLHSDIDLIDAITPRRKSEKYAVRLWLNGCQRIVTFDDQVPVPLIVKSSSNRLLLWPALLEKAYLKLLKNGYDHQGSNFAIDAYMLTGWIPDFYRVSDLTSSKIQHFYRLFKEGKILLGIGTGRLTKEESDYYGILANHDYSVQSIIKNGEFFFSFVVKNPLLKKGNKNRVFKIDDLQVFQILYVNINPKIYQFQMLLNFLHNPQKFGDIDHYHSPQFSVINKTSGPIEIILLLERHLTDNEFESESYLNINIYKTDGQRIWGNNYLKIVQGTENNTRYHTTSFTLLEAQCTIMVISRNKLKRLRAFTLKAFSTADFNISKAKNKYNKILEENGEWCPTNSYGSFLHQDFIKNPQYELYFPASQSKEVKTVIGLISNDIALNLDIFIKTDTSFRFLTHYDSKNLVVQNSTYQKGKVIYSDLVLNTNTVYLLILSTKEKVNVKVPYVLLINYDDKYLTNDAVLKPVGTNLGLFNSSLSFNWGNSTRHRLKICHEKRTVLQMRLIFSSEHFSDYRPKLQILIFKMEANDKEMPIIANGDFHDKFYGTFLKVDLEAGSYIILIERPESGGGSCRFEIGGDHKFDLIDYL